MNNNDFIMLRSLFKEDYQEGNNVLWKRRKKKWDYNNNKNILAIEICEKFKKDGIVISNKIICGLCGEAHSDKMKYTLSEKGISLLEKINKMPNINNIPPRKGVIKRIYDFLTN